MLECVGMQRILVKETLPQISSLTLYKLSKLSILPPVLALVRPVLENLICRLNVSNSGVSVTCIGKMRTWKCQSQSPGTSSDLISFLVFLNIVGYCVCSTVTVCFVSFCVHDSKVGLCLC